MRFCLLLALLFVSVAHAQKFPTIEEKTAGLKKFDGFINFYWDENAGKVWLEVDKLDSEIIYQTSLPAGLGSNDIGLDRGLLGSTALVKFSRVGRKLLLIQPNMNYRAVTSDVNEQRAVEQSFAQSVIWGFAIEAESGGKVLVDATDFFIRDAIKVANRVRSTQQGNYTFDKSRSAIFLPRTKNFALNTEIEATITLVNSDGNNGGYVQSVTPSADAITLRVHHSFVQLPDKNYEPRRFDPRSGFIPISYFDYATPVSEPIEKFFIIRHRLKKKDPAAAVSEPVQPIIYYLDNATPEPIRGALLNGAKWWNQAFESAGFKNAFQVRILPDSADPMDIRYNMINWVHRSTRGWSYGAAVVDPRTGEIIKGNVTLGSLRVRQDYLIAQGLLSPFQNGVPANDPMLKMALERLSQLAAHEVGHTLGLMHNYAASVTDRASVMDYPHPLIHLDAKDQIDFSKAYDDKIGAWDKTAIQWGYGDFQNAIEADTLNQILSAAEKNGLQYISDRDARAAGGLHPQAHLWDNGNNAVKELTEVMKVRKKALLQFGENNIRTGVPMAMLEDVLVPVYLFHRYQLEAVTKIVGGMYYTYATRGDGQIITKPLARSEQLGALTAALDCISPENLLIPDRISKLIPPRPAGYEYNRELFNRRTGLSFDPLAAAETAADYPLSFLFNTERLNRMVQFKTRTEGLGADEMIDTVISKTWKSPRLKNFDELIQLQNEQLVLSYLLAVSVSDNASFAVKSFATKALNDIKTLSETRLKTVIDGTYKAHLLLTLERIRFPEKAKPATLHEAMPPGAPIGCDWDQ